MPRANWEVTTTDVRNFDRSKQFTPYRGPLPPAGAVYQWQVKRAIFAAGTDEKVPQLRLGLELVPTSKEERRYKGYYVMTFRTVTANSQFVYVPFLDAIGVSENDFVNKTQIDSEGNIQRIGNWRNKGDQMILGQLIDSDNGKGGTRRDIRWIGPLDDPDNEDDEDDEDDYIDDEDEKASNEYEEDEEEAEEPEPAPKRRKVSSRSNTRRTRRSKVDDEEDPF